MNACKDNELNYKELNNTRRSADNGKIDPAYKVSDLHFARLIVREANYRNDKSQHHSYKNGEKCYQKRCSEAVCKIMPAVLFNEILLKTIDKSQIYTSLSVLLSNFRAEYSAFPKNRRT